MDVAIAEDGRTVVGRTYRLTVGVEGPRAVLAGRDGAVWSELSLLASLDRVGAVDESLAPGAPRVRRVSDDEVVVQLACPSSAWDSKVVRLRCLPDSLELTATVVGAGTLTDVRLLGGRGLLANGACGTFRSSAGFASVFVPTPTEPVALVRPAAAAAALGVVGDASPGRLHAVFSPPPMCLVLGREAAAGPLAVPAGDWLSLGVVAPVADTRFTELRYEPVDGGFLVALDYDAHTGVAGAFTTPPLVLRPVADPWRALRDHRDDLVAAGAPTGPVGPAAPWWSEPIFCGWGAQCARAGTAVAASDLSRADVYDELLAHLAAHGVVPGTVVVDDKWQAAYGTGEPDAARWPDLRAWVARRHAAGQHVLLWWKAWDAEGLPVDECLVDPAGRPVAVDPEHPGYRARLRRVVAALLGPDGIDADGFKVDFTQRAPTGHALHRWSGGDGAWGVALLHRLLADLYAAAKAAKPDALVVTHTPHPAFADVCDMVRLNDVLERDVDGRVVPQADQLRVRRSIAAATLPGHLVDTDQWPMLDRAQWRAYLAAQAEGGVPALYYAERIDRSGEELGPADLALVARTWAEYRAGRR